MTKELEELKKQRQVAELQEQIWAEQQLLEASRHRLSIAAASASPKNSPAPTTAPAIISSPQTAVVSQIVAVQQIQHPKPPVQASIVQAQSTPASMKGKENNTPTQVQPFRVPAVGDDSGMATSTFTQRPIAVSTSAPENPSQQQQKEQNTHQQTAQQQQQQRPWFDRPRTPDAPADSTLLQLPPYQGQTREEYTKFISALEAHFTKAPQYYSKDVEYRKVKIGLEHLIPALRDAWYALPAHSDTWQNFRIYLFKAVVQNMKPPVQDQRANMPQTPTSNVEKAQTLIAAAKQPPQDPGNTQKQTAKPAQYPSQTQANASLQNGVSQAPAPADFTSYANVQQKQRETVQSYSRRLQASAPFNKALGLNDQMGFLKRGVVSSIRNRAHRPFSYYKTYDEYVTYLQDIEDTLPQRLAELKGEPLQGQSKPGSSRGPISDEKNGSQISQLSPSSGPRGRSPARAAKAQGKNHQVPHDLPARAENGPTSPTARKSVPHRMSSPVPPEPAVKSTDGRDWWACRNFIGALETHFKKYHQYYTEERKVATGRRYIDSSLMGELNAYASKRPQMTWFDICVFVINQSAQSFTPDDAASRYIRCVQRPNQRIRDFALWVQQFAPHYRRPGWDELRHLYDRASPAIKNRARKDWKDFSYLAPFVDYLEAVENTSPDTPKDKGADNTLFMVPRKRGRED
jgi:hypothetical protein